VGAGKSARAWLGGPRGKIGLMGLIRLMGLMDPIGLIGLIQHWKKILPYFGAA
jgi:hypothetical protein